MFKYADFKPVKRNSAQVESMLQQLSNDGLIIKNVVHERQWIGAILVCQLVKAVLIDADKNGELLNVVHLMKAQFEKLT